MHNFADPHLRGSASPNHETVWTCVDRAHMLPAFVAPASICGGDGTGGNGDVCVVLELFLSGAGAVHGGDRGGRGTTQWLQVTAVCTTLGRGFSFETMSIHQRRVRVTVKPGTALRRSNLLLCLAPV